MKFILDNLVPDYLKFEFEIYSLNPKYKFSEVEKIKKMTKYQITEKKENASWTLFDDYLWNVQFNEEQYKIYQSKMPELKEVKEAFSL